MDPLTAEKLAARRQYRRISRLHTLFRCAEAFAALFLLSWSSARLSTVARLAVHLLRRSASVLLGTRFIFLIGNAIILTLFALSCRHPNPSADGGDIYDQVLARQSRAAQSVPPPSAAEEAPMRGEKVRRACRRTRSERMERPQTKAEAAEAAVAEETPVRGEKVKRACERTLSERMERRQTKPEAAEVAEEVPVRGEKVRRACKRTRSERMERPLITKPDLRRSVSEVSGADEAEGTVDAVEFRRIIDSFIASELERFHREESSAGDPHATTIVPYS